MTFLNYFKPVSALTAGRVRELLKEKSIEDFNLVDVRQPREYERGHLPGAKLIPVGQLGSRVHELDQDKPTIAY
jgi:rhodanese-related sulfurtransferase